MTRPLPPLIIVGAGGLARETAEAVHAGGDYELLGLLDDNPELRGRMIGGVRVLGGIDRLGDHRSAQVVIATGRPSDYGSRSRIARRLDLPDERFARVVHPAAILPPTTVMGPGCIVLAGVIATTEVTLGAHVAVMPAVVLTHDDVVADYVTIASGVRLGGAVQVEEMAYLGAGVLVREGTRIGRTSLVGMGSVVLNDIPPGEVWVGCPARKLSGTPRAR